MFILILLLFVSGTLLAGGGGYFWHQCNAERPIIHYYAQRESMLRILAERYPLGLGFIIPLAKPLYEENLRHTELWRKTCFTGLLFIGLALLLYMVDCEGALCPRLPFFAAPW
jgi:hypothetical protein